MQNEPRSTIDELYEAVVGAAAVRSELADCQWGVYQMLGKLCPTILVARRSG